MKTYTVTDATTLHVYLRGSLQQWDEWFNKFHTHLTEQPVIVSDSRTEKRILVHPLSSHYLKWASTPFVNRMSALTGRAAA